MNLIVLSSSRPYAAPECRVREMQWDQNFLASGDYGNGGYPGGDIEPGDEYDF